ncbi:DUF6671 family protein [Alishewanella longhuensis]
MSEPKKCAATTEPHEHSSLVLKNLQVALLTKHYKAGLIAPALQSIGFDLISTDAFDTDTLGTFAGEVTRQLSPLDCARAKAKLAVSLTGLSIGLGSEGSFGGGPMPGLVNWDEELLLYLDGHSGQEIVAFAAGPVPLAVVASDDLGILQAHMTEQDLQQGWILRHAKGVVKGLVGISALEQALTAANLLKTNTALKELVQLEPDFRAHLCPARQNYIRQAAEQLAARLQARCPECQAPDFWRKGAERGLPCELCAYPTSQVKYYIKSCSCCGHTEHEATITKQAAATHCPLCNP